MLLPAFTGDCDRSDIHNWQPINYSFVFVLNSSSVASFQAGILLNFGFFLWGTGVFFKILQF